MGEKLETQKAYSQAMWALMGEQLGVHILAVWALEMCSQAILTGGSSCVLWCYCAALPAVSVLL